MHRLREVHTATVDKEHLNIPFTLNVEKEGNYRITGNLFSQLTGEPIAHLSTKGKTVEGKNSMQFKVHASVLKASENPATYVLKNLMIFRIADKDTPSQQYGNASNQHFIVQGFSSDQYSDIAYANEVEQLKLKKLKRFVSQLSSR